MTVLDPVDFNYYFLPAFVFYDEIRPSFDVVARPDCVLGVLQQNLTAPNGLRQDSTVCSNLSGSFKKKKKKKIKLKIPQISSLSLRGRC